MTSKKRKRANPPSPPHPHEWLYRKTEVPDEEVAACLTWEYMREVRPESCPDGLSAYALGLLIGYKRSLDRMELVHHYNDIPLHVLKYLSENTVPGFTPWQSQDPNLRKELSRPRPPLKRALIAMEPAKTSGLECRLPSPTSAEINQEDEEAIIFYHSQTAKVSMESRNPQSDAGDSGQSKATHHGSEHLDPRFFLQAQIEQGFITPLPFLINWPEYTNEQILGEIKCWLEDNRPTGTIRPKQGTKISDLRPRLRDLGAMRIFSTMTDRAFKRHPNYALFAGPTNRKSRDGLLDLNLSRMAREAEGYFKQYFSLTEDQTPISSDKLRP